MNENRVDDKVENETNETDEVNNKNNNRLEKQKVNNSFKTKIAIGVTILAGTTICFFTGCFTTHHTIQNNQMPIVIKQNYSILINEWNREVIKAKLSDDYLLPRDNSEKIITKLNDLIKNTKDYQTFSEKYRCVLSKQKVYYLPIREYANYLKNNQIKKNTIFNSNENEEKIIAELKKNFNSKFIDVNMLKKLAYLRDFKQFFNDNLTKFKKEGLPTPLQDYGYFMKFIKKYNKTCKD